MSNEEVKNKEWRYFGRDPGTGKFCEIYRCPANGKSVLQQKLEDVQLLLKDGNWRSNMKNELVDASIKGWFDESSDELSEEEAMDYFQKWQAGIWPGRS